MKGEGNAVTLYLVDKGPHMYFTKRQVLRREPGGAGRLSRENLAEDSALSAVGSFGCKLRRVGLDGGSMRGLRRSITMVSAMRS